MECQRCSAVSRLIFPGTLVSFTIQNKTFDDASIQSSCIYLTVCLTLYFFVYSDIRLFDVILYLTRTVNKPTLQQFNLLSIHGVIHIQ